MHLVIDNYDSFTYNLVQYLGELGAELRVVRNDAVTLDEVAAMAPEGIVLGPGPGTPRDAGITLDLIRRFGATTPILGVCLGHQAIGEAYGGRVIRAPRGVMHGKTSQIRHDGSEFFEGVQNPFEAMRYHSLVVEAASLPKELRVTATAADDATEIHALQHASQPVMGVQFHPESIGTPAGMQILRNFLKLGARMLAPRRQLLGLATVFTMVLSGCLPYAVGSTAQTVPRGEVVRSANAAFVIGGSAPFEDSTESSPTSSNFLSSDQEIRFGLSDRSDVGLRVTSASGLVLTYKRRHSGAAHQDSAGIATMWGAGIVNWANHTLIEGTLIVSGDRRGEVTPYGGLRIMKTYAIEEGAVIDKPSAGGFLGFRIGSADRGITPEIAIYYDESALGIRERNVIFVPSVTLTGISFLPRIFR